MPRRSELRASDADRERCQQALGAHFAAGRLEADELEERMARAARARTIGELRALTADLPRLDALVARQRWGGKVSRWDRMAVRAHLWWFAGANGTTVGLWALTGAGEFWPAWVLVPTTALLGSHLAGRRAVRRRLRSAAGRRPRIAR